MESATVSATDTWEPGPPPFRSWLTAVAIWVVAGGIAGMAAGALGGSSGWSCVGRSSERIPSILDLATDPNYYYYRRAG